MVSVAPAGAPNGRGHTAIAAALMWLGAAVTLLSTCAADAASASGPLEGRGSVEAAQEAVARILGPELTAGLSLSLTPPR